jgi:hypothetical protein
MGIDGMFYNKFILSLSSGLLTSGVLCVYNVCMRINITLPDKLFKDAREFSNRKYWSFSELVKNALIEYTGSAISEKGYTKLDHINEEGRMIDLTREFHPQPKGGK